MIPAWLAPFLKPLLEFFKEFLVDGLREPVKAVDAQSNETLHQTLADQVRARTGGRL